MKITENMNIKQDSKVSNKDLRIKMNIKYK